MKKRNLTTVCLTLAILSVGLAGANRRVRAQDEPQQQSQTRATEVSVQRETGRMSFTPERGSRIAIGNRTTGRIRIIGWERDAIEATATSERGAEIVKVERTVSESGIRFYVTTDYAPENNASIVPLPRSLPTNRSISPEPGASASAPRPAASPTPTPHPPSAPPSTPDDDFFGFFFRPREINIEVKLPRNSDIETINVMRSEVEVTGVESHLQVSGARSDIRLSHVGSVAVRTRSGDVHVENAAGQVNVLTANGNVRVQTAASDVRVVSIGGEIDIRCVRGRVEANNTDNTITLDSIGGDVEATTTNGNINFTGALRPDGRYRLSSTAGQMEMRIPENTSGFTATLASYMGGRAISDFPLTPVAPAEGTRRTTGRYGNGRAQITLDTFNGSIWLRRAAMGTMENCNFTRSLSPPTN
jgi:hypothetical protein